MRIHFCAEGLVVENRGRSDCYRWEEIVKIQETSEVDAIHFIRLGVSRSAVVEFADGKSLLLNRNRVRHVGELIDNIQRAIWSHRYHDQGPLKDERLARVVAAWSKLPRYDQARILGIVDDFRSEGGDRLRDIPPDPQR